MVQVLTNGAALHRALEELNRPVDCIATRLRFGLAPVVARAFTVLIVKRGVCILHGDFPSSVVQEGDLVFISPGTRCGGTSTEIVDAFSVAIDASFMVDQLRWARPAHLRSRRLTYEFLLRRNPYPAVLHPETRVWERLTALCEDICKARAFPDAPTKIILLGTRLVWELESLYPPLPQARVFPLRLREPFSPRDEVAQALEILRHNYRDAVSVSAIAETVALSESALRRAFLKATGVSLRQYLHRLRFLRYEELVVTTDVPLAKAAALAGWSSSSHARAVFSRMNGVSPSVYRATQGKHGNF